MLISFSQISDCSKNEEKRQIYDLYIRSIRNAIGQITEILNRKQENPSQITSLESRATNGVLEQSMMTMFDKNLSSTTISDGNFLKIFNKLKDNFKITRKMENDALKQFAIDFEKLLQESSDTFSRTITNFKSGTD